MKNLLAIFAILAIIMVAACNNSANSSADNKDSVAAIDSVALSSAEFVVNGNCDMCKERIETAATELEGVESAVWNSETQMIKVAFNANLCSVDALQKKIAEVGHDTEVYKATDASYNELHNCCKYRTTEK